MVMPIFLLWKIAHHLFSSYLTSQPADKRTSREDYEFQVSKS